MTASSSSSSSLTLLVFFCLLLCCPDQGQGCATRLLSGTARVASRVVRVSNVARKAIPDLTGLTRTASGGLPSAPRPRPAGDNTWTYVFPDFYSKKPPDANFDMGELMAVVVLVVLLLSLLVIVLGVCYRQIQQQKEKDGVGGDVERQNGGAEKSKTVANSNSAAAGGPPLASASDQQAKETAVI